jgi:hypothetical protein
MLWGMQVSRTSPMWGVLRWCTLAGACTLAATTLAGCTGAAQPAVSSAEERARERSLPVPYDLQEGVARANILGTNLFLLDVATARAWDALAERIGGAPDQNGIGHYLALMGDDGEGRLDGSVQVMFYTNDDVPRLAYRVIIGGSARHAPEVVEQTPPAVVHEPVMTLLNARWLALEAVPRSDQVVNTVLIPQQSGRIIVYVLAATSQPNMAVLGRHYRVEVADDGAAVERVTALAKAALELPTRDGSGQRLASLAITDGEAEHPTETHVFASRLANVPLYVTTGRGRWKVRATGIDYLGPR